MHKLTITGGRALAGEVKISGAKNAALPALFAALLTGEPCRLRNVPRLRDISSAVSLLRSLGAEVSRRGGDLRVCAAGINRFAAPYETVRTMRASILVLGPLLARFGRAAAALPGGCAIGSRPVDVHIDNLRKMGADIRVENGDIRAECGRLRGAHLLLETPSVTGTENLLMAAALADGETIIENAAREPEVADLAALLRKMGAQISDGGGALRVQGVAELRGVAHTIMPDRIEAGTYLAAVAAAGGDIFLRGARAEDMQSVLSVFAAGGAAIKAEDGGIRARMNKRFRATGAQTAPYPGYPTDMQAQLMAVNATARGSAAITENIFENRFMHVRELARMGARIDLSKNTAVVTGAPRLTGAPVMATDLRASASLVIAALAAEGKTEIRRIYHLERGYESLEKKLRAIGAAVKRARD